MTTQNAATYTFTAVADAYVAADFATNNYGLSGTLKTDAAPDYRSYLRFHVNDIRGNIASATLRLYTTSSSSTGYQVQRVTDQNWEESSITYSNAPAPAGAIGSSGNFASVNWISVDVTSLIGGSGVYDFAITTNANVMSFSSRDASSNAPQLVIQTTAGTVPTVTPSPTLPTSTATRTPTTTVTATPATPTATGSASTFTFTTIADARVAQASPTTNYGTANNLQADSGSTDSQISYIRFTTSGLNGPVQRAPLRVYCTTNSTTNGPAVQLADSGWVESGTGSITWNNRPALLSGAVDNKGSFGTNTWIEYDVTSLVSGNGAYTFALVADSSDGVTFSSREGTAASQLIVETSSGPTVTPASTATRTATPTMTAPPTPTASTTATSTKVPASTNTPTATPTVTSTDAAPVPSTPTLTQPVPGTGTATATSTLTTTATFTQTATPTPTGTVASAPITSTFLPVADAYVNAEAPTTNYGTATTLRADNSPIVRSYLRFTVQGLNGTVTKATLRIFANSASTSGIVAQSVSNNTWTESTVNYNNAPPVGTSIGSSPPFGAGVWITIDVTAYITGDGAYNLALTTPSTTAVSLASRQAGANAPQLIIETAP